jgi:hypothetical protein
MFGLPFARYNGFLLSLNPTHRTACWAYRQTNTGRRTAPGQFMPPEITFGIGRSQPAGADAPHDAGRTF